MPSSVLQRDDSSLQTNYPTYKKEFEHRILTSFVCWAMLLGTNSLASIRLLIVLMVIGSIVELTILLAACSSFDKTIRNSSEVLCELRKKKLKINFQSQATSA